MNKIALGIFLVIVLAAGVYLYSTRMKAGQRELAVTPTPVSTTPLPATSPVSEVPLKDLIIQALAQKNNWDVSRVELNVNKVEGDFAKGDVRFKDEMGGGLWFAAKVNGVWKIVFDGNGTITCDTLTNYQNFPKDLIPECFDIKAEKLIKR